MLAKEQPCRSSPAVKTTLPNADEALPGRDDRPFAVADKHVVLDAPVITDEVPEGYEVALFGLGCFWGAEEIYWQVPGVWSTSVGYAGGITPNPTYEEVCSGRTGHTEAVRVVYDPAQVSLRRPGEDVLRGPRPDPGHAPGQRRRHPVPLGDLLDDARAGADRPRADRDLRRRARTGSGIGDITTEIRPAAETPYYYAEDHHQQYLAKNPFGYRCHANTGPTSGSRETADPVGSGARRSWSRYEADTGSAAEAREQT